MGRGEKGRNRLGSLQRRQKRRPHESSGSRHTASVTKRGSLSKLIQGAHPTLPVLTSFKKKKKLVLHNKPVSIYFHEVQNKMSS